jgi:thermitase
LLLSYRFSLNVLLALGVLTAACACGSGSEPSLDGGERINSLAAAASASTGNELNQVELDAAWQEILANPGTPGVNYDPGYLTLTYLPGAKLPKGVSGIEPTLGGSAASQGNPGLRQLRGYEPLTDAIAGTFGIQIDQQVYLDGMLLASFKLPAGTDGDAVIAGIRAQFAGAVDWVTYSRIYRASFDPSDFIWAGSNAGSGGQWGLHKIGCESAWDITRGDPAIRLAVLDTGIRLGHEELGQVLDPELVFASSKCDIPNNDNTVEDTQGHGTFIAGLVGATANNFNMVGVAHLGEIIPIKIANGGTALDAHMAAGSALAGQLGAQVINLSWGGPNHNPVLQNMVNLAVNNGILFVCAAGNDNKSSPDYPASYSNALCVGSTNQSDGRSSFSNFGTYVDMAAPGQDLVSCGPGANNQYVIAEGTSFAAPIVAAAGALLLSVQPSLEVAELRELLELSGDPTTNFGLRQQDNEPVRRLNIATALSQTSSVVLRAPRPMRLIQSGVITLTPEVIGEAEMVSAYLNGELVSSLSAAPWDFEIDTTDIQFGRATVEFRAVKSGDLTSKVLDILIDNTGGTFPILEHFDGGSVSFTPIDAKSCAQNVLGEMFSVPENNWTVDSISGGGEGLWSASGDSQSGSGSRYCGIGASTYGAFEVDALVSKKVTLTGTKPTMVFYHHFNIERGDNNQAWDRAWVLVTADGGQTFAPATLKAGGQAFFSGLQEDWVKAEVDLSAWKNTTVNIALVFNSDSVTAGENIAEPAGWWVDTITVATNYSEDVPTIGGVNLDAYTVTGAVPGLEQLNVNVLQPSRVSRVRYVLDCEPLGSIDVYDTIVNVEASPFVGEVDLPTPDVPNQIAQLRVQYFDSSDVAGPEVAIPLYIFNLRGDANADGTVDQADHDAFPGKIGLSTGDLGYSPFFDSDQDGTITEADASAVGYNWGEEID